ncbi:zinc-ribbon domain-containing protein [Peribacillus sp. YIM B13472]|uniref:zinc-ribbon domain-containing protein n=1 Tax=Peribacillus sp. YIM B13472 TaxID=3366297 RepID=UPI0036723179
MLGDSYPHLLKQWHPTLNTDICIDSVTPGSGKKVWWICNKGHEWEAVIRTRTTIGVGCPYCSNRKVCMDNSLATIVPSLALQWHPTKNGTLSPNDVVYGSTKNVWWQCERGHEWRAKVEYRYHKKSGCPFCNLEDNSLLTKQPFLCKEWHPSRNFNLTPAKVTQSSQRKVWWLCKEGHEWAAVISSRSRGHGCPYCAGTKRNTVPLIDSHPEAAQLWDGNKNSPLTLNDVDAYSQKVVWWKCPEGHEWEKEIYYQVNKPCSICNSLAHKNPETVKYWDVFKNNPLSPWEISYGSSTVVWWKCKKGHEWQASIAARRNKKFCPKCRGGTSFGEQAIFYYLKKCFSKVENRYKHNSVELDLYIPSLKIGIEYDGKYYHNSNAAKHRDNTKVQVLSKDGIRLIRLRERGLPSLWI